MKWKTISILILLISVSISFASQQLVSPIMDESDPFFRMYGVAAYNNTITENYLWTGNQTFFNITVYNMSVYNITGNVTASGFCYLNGTCIEGYLTVYDNVCFSNGTDLAGVNCTGNTGGDNLGNHIATTTLDMQNNKIDNINYLNVTDGTYYLKIDDNGAGGFGITYTGDEALRLSSGLGANLQFFPDSNGVYGGQFYFDSGNAVDNGIHFRTNAGGTENCVMKSDGTTSCQTINPDLDSTRDFGSDSLRWLNGWFYNIYVHTIQGSNSYLCDFDGEYCALPILYDKTYTNYYDNTGGSIVDGESGNIISLRNGILSSGGINVYDWMTNTMGKALDMGGYDISDIGTATGDRFKIGNWGFTCSGNSSVTDTTNLVLWYKFEDDLLDSSTSANNGVGSGSYSYQTGKVGKAFQSQDESATTYMTTPVTLGTTSTLAGWYYLTSDVSNYNPLWTHGGYKEAYYGYDGGYLGITGGNYKSTKKITANEWHFIVFVDNGTAIKGYIDGEDAGDSVGIYESFNGWAPDRTIQGQNGNNFFGKTDELMIFNNRALSLAEIQALGNCGGKIDTGEELLIEGSGRITGNLTVNNNLNVYGNSTFYGDISFADTFWDDVNVGGAVLGKGVNAPTMTGINNTGIEIPCFAGSVQNDYVSGCVEMPHNWKTGSDAEIHLHTLHDSTSTNPMVWKADVKIMNMTGQGRKDVIMYNLSNPAGQWLPNYIDFIDLNMTGFQLGTQVCFRLTRVQNNVSDTNTGGDCLVTFGIHYQIDSVGSREEYLK
jgi:hypothetical protein